MLVIECEGRLRINRVVLKAGVDVLPRARGSSTSIVGPSKQGVYVAILYSYMALHMLIPFARGRWEAQQHIWTYVLLTHQ